MANIGRILLIPKGDYNSAISYEMLDIVKHAKASWVCKKPCKNQTPSTSNTEYWQKLCDDGIDITSVEQTTTSTEDYGENVVTVTLSNGVETEIKIRNGRKGSTGDAAGFGACSASITEDASTNEPSINVLTSGSNTAKVFEFEFVNLKGSQWYRGKKISSTGATEFIPTESDVTYANKNDCYINIDEGKVYQCTLKGNASTAKWIYVLTLQGGGGTGEWDDIEYKPFDSVSTDDFETEDYTDGDATKKKLRINTTIRNLLSGLTDSIVNLLAEKVASTIVKNIWVGANADKDDAPDNSLVCVTDDYSEQAFSKLYDASHNLRDNVNIIPYSSLASISENNDVDVASAGAVKSLSQTLTPFISYLTRTSVYSSKYNTNVQTTLSSDGWYHINNELSSEDGANKYLIVNINGKAAVSKVTNGYMYDHCEIILPLKAGTVIEATYNGTKQAKLSIDKIV